MAVSLFDGALVKDSSNSSSPLSEKSSFFNDISSPSKIGGNLMTQNCPNLEKYLFPGISGCSFGPFTGGPGESSYPESPEYVWQKRVGGQKCLVMGGF